EGMFIYGPGIAIGTTLTTFSTATAATMSANALVSGSGIPVRFSFFDPQVLGAGGGTLTHALTLNQMPSHYHPFSDYYQYLAGNVSGLPWGSAGQFNTVGAYTANNTGYAGGSWTHPNLQPSYVCNKIIKYSPPGTTAVLSPGTGDVTGPSASTDGELAMFSGTSGKFIRRGGVLPSSYRLPRGWLAALKTSNNPVDQVNDIDIQDGECRDSTNTVDMVLPFGMTKRIDLPWAAGTDQGGLDAT